MELYRPLWVFFERIGNDPRICIAHIGLFATLLQLWQSGGFPDHIEAYSYEVMEVARISSRATYHRCIRDLHDFGYLQYFPSFNKKRRSKIILVPRDLPVCKR